MTRALNRAPNLVRPVQVTYGIFEYAAGSVLFQIGKTKVLCAVTISDGVPHFLRGSGSGWLTAEYAMIPASTHSRIERESIKKRHGRSVEISRLIGRSLRSAIDITAFGERTMIIDCDVLQADGGTRSAAITGSFCALKMAQQRLLDRKVISRPFLRHEIAAISVGCKEGQLLLDLDCKEDQAIDADFNFVMTRAGDVIEVQGSAEKGPLAWTAIHQMKDLAALGVDQMFEYIDSYDQELMAKELLSIPSARSGYDHVEL